MCIKRQVVSAACLTIQEGEMKDAIERGTDKQ